MTYLEKKSPNNNKIYYKLIFCSVIQLLIIKYSFLQWPSVIKYQCFLATIKKVIGNVVERLVWYYSCGNEYWSRHIWNSHGCHYCGHCARVHEPEDVLGSNMTPTSISANVTMSNKKMQLGVEVSSFLYQRVSCPLGWHGTNVFDIVLAYNVVPFVSCHWIK